MTARDVTGRGRAYWDRESGEYQRQHGGALAREPRAWGVWRILEAQLGILTEPGGRDVLELGCGAAQWSAGLAARGARVRGLDLSRAQLRAAAAHTAASAVAVPLLQANAEQLPFADAVFDVVFCDHGATTFARPERLVPEVARVLRPDGLFAFCSSTPLRDLCWLAGDERISERLRRSRP